MEWPFFRLLDITGDEPPHILGIILVIDMISILNRWVILDPVP